MKSCILIVLIIILLLFIINDKYFNFFFSANFKYSMSSIDLNKLYSAEYQNNKIKLYYINMDKSIERNKRFLERMDKFNNYDITRIKAITPNELSNFNIQSPLLCSLFMKPAEFSCTLSHLIAIETSYNNNDQYSLISEDDLIINKNINWNYLISKLPYDWDIIQMHTSHMPHFNNYTKYNIFKNNWLLKSNSTLPSTALYLISNKGMKKILNRYKIKNNITLNNHSKYCVADNLLYSNVNRYLFTLPFCEPEDLDSNISSFYLRFRTLIK